jgi:eukaryotic-like serine/threonine-protein kinase
VWALVASAVAIAVATVGLFLAYRVSTARDGSTEAPVRTVVEAIGSRDAPPVAASGRSEGDVKRMVALSVISKPVTAIIELDGTRLGTTPLLSQQPADERTHLLRLSAPGFQALEQSVAFRSDVYLQLNLDRAPVASRPVPRGKPKPAASAEPTGARPVASTEAQGKATTPPGASVPSNTAQDKRALDDDPYAKTKRRRLDTDDPFAAPQSPIDAEDPWKK